MISGYNKGMVRKDIKFNSDLLRSLIEGKNGSIEQFSKDFTNFGYPVTRQAVQLWLVGRKPRIEALVYLSEYFNKPIKKFLKINDMISYHIKGR